MATLDDLLDSKTLNIILMQLKSLLTHKVLRQEQIDVVRGVESDSLKAEKVRNPLK
jgi:hypothetical protein